VIPQSDNSGVIVLAWEDLQISVPVNLNRD